MIKKIIIISSILFFGFVGNVLAIELPTGNVYGDDLIPFPIIEIVPGGEPYPVFTYIQIKDDVGIWFLNINPYSPNPGTWREVLSVEPYMGTWQVPLDENYSFHLDKTFEIRNTTCGQWDGCVFNSSEVILRPNPILSMPETATTDLLGNVGGLFSNFWPIISIMFGVPLSFYIIPKVIALIPK